MPSEDLKESPDAAGLGLVSDARRSSSTFAQALPESLRGLFQLGRPRDHVPPELAFLVAEGISPRRLESAARAAVAAGVTGEAALFGLGISDDLYYRLLARHLGAPYLDHPLPLAAGGFDLAAASRKGIAPLAPNPARLRRVHAPSGKTLRMLLEGHRFHHRGYYGFAVTTPRRLDALLRRHDEAGLLERAADGLANWDASLSARDGATPWQTRLALLVMTMVGFGCGAAPFGVGLAVSLVLFPLFAAAVAQRLLVVARGSEPAAPISDEPHDRDLPVYTVLVPLFREAQILPQLVRALDALDYPALCRKRNISHHCRC